MTAPTDTFTDNLRFLRALIARPKNVGAVVPSSRALARAIARQIDPARQGPILELGPGTGVITAANRSDRSGAIFTLTLPVAA